MKRTPSGIVIGTAAGAIGTAMAAVLGSVCCAGPVVVAVLGAGGALTAAKLAPLRPYLLALSSVMLLVGFWRTYRPRATAAGGLACSAKTGRTVKAVLWVAAAITLVSAIVPELVS